MANPVGSPDWISTSVAEEPATSANVIDEHRHP
jgi:hypothetical protein